MFSFKHQIFRFIIIGIFSLFLLNCKKNQSTKTDEFPPLVVTDLNIDGGKWKTILLNSPTEISVQAPSSVGSQEYLKEIEETQKIIKIVSPSQAEMIKFWQSGAVLRWNEIARELVAKYNHTPQAGLAPDPNHPMASPPFAARAYALLSVAQYDALVTAWHYKYVFNRLGANRYGISNNQPINDLPAYPSEDAVVASVSYSILAYLFPAEKNYLYQKALEHGSSRVWSGSNLKSELEAGGDLGQKVAQKVIAYAEKDNFKDAVDFDNDWKKNADKVKDAWESQESPKRPPLLPKLGDMKTWFDKKIVLGTVPPPPPSLDSDEFKEDLKNVNEIAKNRTPEQQKIAEFWADGAGTFTPPGHWNQIAEELIRTKNLSELQTAQILATMNRASHDAAVACWYTKYKYFFPRPSQVDTSIKKGISLPNFPSYTSGHSTFSASASKVLSHFFPQDSTKLRKMAEEAGISRVYGGIHFNCDNIQGKNCGAKIGDLAVKWLQK
jgi:hypothetical protein